MIVPIEVKQKYEYSYPYITQIEKKVRETIIQYCTENNFAFSGRIKTLESLFEKIETGRFNNWNEIDDVYACSIIVPSLNDEDEVIYFLTQIFKEESIKRRNTSMKAPDVFRFDSTRCIFKLRSNEITSNNELNKIKFEIQIKTAFEHAWGVATHSLVYKSDKIDWKLIRLCAQIKANVEQLDMIISGANSIFLELKESHWPEVEIKSITADRIESLFDKEIIPLELIPKDISRFCENIFSLMKCCDGLNLKKPKQCVDSFFQTIESELLKLGILNVPKSISLLQLFAGILFNSKMIVDFKGYIPYISHDLLTFYPELKVVEKKFRMGNE